MLRPVSTIERRRAAAARASARLRRALGEEFRSARIQTGLSQAEVGRASGLSGAEVSRIERGDAPWLTIDAICRLAASLGLDVSTRLYPAGPPIRDRAQLALLERLRGELPGGVRWQVEVPLSKAGDGRAWDAVITGRGSRLAVEAETRLHDVQALERRIALKQRDDGDVAVLLLVNDTRINRGVLATARPSLQALLPLGARAMLSALRAGRHPGESGIVLL